MSRPTPAKLASARRAARAVLNREQDSSIKVETALEHAGEVLGGYGVAGMSLIIDGHHVGFSYVNMGDPYTPTLAYMDHSNQFRILTGGWGDLAERERTCSHCGLHSTPQHRLTRGYCAHCRKMGYAD